VGLLTTYCRARAWIFAGCLFSCATDSETPSSAPGDWIRCSTVNDCAPQSSAVACQKGYCVDSNGQRVRWPAFCTLINLPLGADAATAAAFIGDAASSCVISASSYDTTCRRDSDCIEVKLGDMCLEPCGVLCGGEAISTSDYQRYLNDFGRSPLGPFVEGPTSLACGGIICSCPARCGVHCNGGRCEPKQCFTDAG